MLYLDYAKKVEEGYILNFFADSEDDIKEVSGGKEFITKNGTNYGAPLPSSTVVITMPDKSRKTYILDDGNNWVVGGEPSGVAVEANVATTDRDEELVSLKVGDKTYKNSKMIPYESAVVPSNEVLKGVEYDKKVYRMPTGMTPAAPTALVTGGVVETAEYNGKVYNVGGFNKKFYQKIILTISETPSYINGLFKYDIKEVICNNGKDSTIYETDEAIYTFLRQEFINENNIYVVKDRYYVVVNNDFGIILQDAYSSEYFLIFPGENKVLLIMPMFIGGLYSNNGKMAYQGHNLDATTMTLNCFAFTYLYDMTNRMLRNFDAEGNPIIDVKFDDENSIIRIDTLQNDIIVRNEYNFTTLNVSTTELGSFGGGLTPYTGEETATKDLDKVEYKGTVYNVGGLTPYTGAAVPGTDLKQVEYKGTVYNVGGGSSGGAKSLVLEINLSSSNEFYYTFDTEGEYRAFVEGFKTGSIDVTFNVTPARGYGGYAFAAKGVLGFDNNNGTEYYICYWSPYHYGTQGAYSEEYSMLRVLFRFI